MTLTERLRFDSTAPAQTRALGAALGRCLHAGHGLALSGELGAGKTVFVQGLAVGLGVEDPSEVRSPTYLLLVEHPGPIPLLHMDAYFAQRGLDFLADGGAAYSAETGVLAVEWAEKLGGELPDTFLRVAIQHVDETRRSVVLSGCADVWGRILAELEELVGSGRFR